MENTSDDGGRTVGEVAGLLGVTTRTLHYWEECGLVVPSARTWSNYRLYSDADIARLQQIMIYRATGMGLESIAEVLARPASSLEHLHRQRALLEQHSQRLSHMVAAVDELVEKTMNNTNLSVDEVAEILGDANLASYQQEAEERWGDTPEWQQSQQNAAAYSQKDWEGKKDQWAQVEAELVAGMQAGVTPGSDEANRLAELHRALISEFFAVSVSQQVIVAAGYTADPRFESYYEERGEGLAAWLRAIIEENARAQGVDPTAARWE